MRFKVPQFIEIEDKIFGPFSFKQFAYLVGGAGLSIVLWRLLPILVAFIFILPIVALSLALAFYKPNNRPFVDMLESAVRYSFGHKLYLWKHSPKKMEAAKDMSLNKESLMNVPELSHSKLKDIAWELDIKESVYTEETKPE